MSEAVPLATTLRWIWSHPANRGARVRALGRFAAWQLRKRVSGQPAYTAVAGGGELEVPLGSTSASAALYAGGWPDWHEMQLARRWLRPGDTAVDVGANVGVWTLVLAAAVTASGRVVAFEPDPGSADQLERNLRRNGWTERVALRREVVAARSGPVAFAVGAGTRGRIEATGAEVPGRALDDLTQPCPRLVKVDVEGAESLVLAGAGTWLGAVEPPLWIVEWNACVAPGALARRELFSWLRKRAWALAIFDADARRLTAHRAWSVATEPRPGANRILIRDDRIETTARELGAALRVRG